MTRNSELSGTLHEGMEQARERLEETQERLTQAAQRMKEKGEEAWDDLTGYVKKNPGKTVAFSIGLGVLIGVLLNRSSRD